jgi:aryl-alcohol dehydrogenase-like predicted oxidoreductase
MGRLVQELDVDSVLVAYNYYPFNVTAREHIIPHAQEKGMAVLVAALFYFVFSLPDNWRSDAATFFGKNTARQREQLYTLQQECGIPMAELVLRFVAADERLASIVVGACHPSEIEQSVAAFNAGRLPTDIHDAIEEIAAQFE